MEYAVTTRSSTSGRISMHSAFTSLRSHFKVTSLWNILAWHCRQIEFITLRISCLFCFTRQQRKVYGDTDLCLYNNTFSYHTFHSCNIPPQFDHLKLGHPHTNNLYEYICMYVYIHVYTVQDKGSLSWYTLSFYFSDSLFFFIFIVIIS